ncbi:MAG: hypothetical protein C0614_00595 [Desulfuromonas sp.]|nr:MAG: hypothetical protein C0614_00595 [Desulfuromonas sp.]
MVGWPVVCRIDGTIGLVTGLNVDQVSAGYANFWRLSGPSEIVSRLNWVEIQRFFSYRFEYETCEDL